MGLFCGLLCSSYKQNIRPEGIRFNAKTRAAFAGGQNGAQRRGGFWCPPMWPALRTFSAAAPEGDKFVNLICFECFQRFHQAARRGIRLDTDFQASVVWWRGCSLIIQVLANVELVARMTYSSNLIPISPDKTSKKSRTYIRKWSQIYEKMPW